MEASESGAPNGQRRPEGTVEEGGGGGVLTVGQRVDRINDTAQEAWTRTRDTVNDLKEALDVDGRVSRNPYGTLAAAVGIGYVLGGGLFSPLTARLVGFGLRMGLRLAAVPFIQNELSALVESVGAGGVGGEAGEESGSKGRKAQHSKATNKGR
jgi:hypothetical protein